MNGIDSLLQAAYAAHPALWWSILAVAVAVGAAIYAIVHAPYEDYPDDIEDR